MSDLKTIESMIINLGPEKSSLKKSYILSLSSKTLDKWRKQVSKCTKDTLISGHMSLDSQYKRGGYLGKISIDHHAYNILVKSDSPAFGKLSSVNTFHEQFPVKIKGTFLLHFELGLVILVSDLKLNPNQFSPGLCSTNIRTSNIAGETGVIDDDKLMLMLKEDIGIRSIAHQFNVEPYQVVNRMLYLGIIDNTVANKLKIALVD